MLACAAAGSSGCAGENVTDVHDDEQAKFSALVVACGQAAQLIGTNGPHLVTLSGSE